MLTSDVDADIDTDGKDTSLYEEEDSLFRPNTNPKLERRRPRVQDVSLDEEEEGAKGKANLSQKSIQAVYAELASISRKLQVSMGNRKDVTIDTLCDVIQGCYFNGVLYH